MRVISERPTDIRTRLQARLHACRAHTDAVFNLVRDDAFYSRPIPERHRVIFYLGHLEAFDWNLLGGEALGKEPVDEVFDRLFAFGIDPVKGQLPRDEPRDWPARRQVADYVARARRAVDEALSLAPLDDDRVPLLKDGFIFEVLTEHRLMHAETLGYMLHRLPFDHKVSVPSRAVPSHEVVEARPIEIPAGSVTLGRPRTGFGWDNEFDAWRVDVPAFAIDATSTTNGEFLHFVEAGGYDDRSLWTDEDFEWTRSNGVKHPAFWVRRKDGWFYRGMFEEIPLPLDWPVYVSHAEARAYARRDGKSLPTEAQFHRAAYGTPEGRERAYPWGDEAPRTEHGNFDFDRWDPCAVTSHPQGKSAFGVWDLVGNGWEWTSTPFEPLPGFERFAFYPSYSADFFDGRHYVLKGGSPGTAACLLRRSFRNWFQPHYPYVYAKFRSVENA